MKPCVFFDRDGVANIAPTSRYVERPEDLQLSPGFPQAVAIATQLGYHTAIATNQRGIALGVTPAQTVAAIHQRLRYLLRNAVNIELLDIFCCPHDHTENCPCRKPKPGLLLHAAQQYDIDLSASWMIGDSETDIWAGRNAGCRTIRVAPPTHASTADFRVPDMAALPILLSRILVRILA